MTNNQKESNGLSERMLSVAGMVTEGNRVADIGCDHGFVSIYLVQNHTAPAVLAMDINDGPLLRAKEHVDSCGLSAYITVRKSDGARQLQWTEDGKRTEADTVIIAGMGGRLIIRILAESMEKLLTVSELILQPQSEISLVRSFLEEHKFQLITEDMIYEEEKYYQVLKAVPGIQRTTKLTDAELAFGPVLLQEKNATLHRYLVKEAEKYNGILEKIQECGGKKQQESMCLVRQKLRVIEEALRSF